MVSNGEDIYTHLVSLYGEEIAKRYLPRVEQIIANFNIQNNHNVENNNFSENDAILITYADQVLDDTHKPLLVLKCFADKYLNGVINSIHLLPFFPYSSDDGFSVVNYNEVNPDHGSWDDVSSIGSSFRLMFDAVINHVSSQSKWFNSFLKDISPYKEYFISVDPNIDLTSVVRPRALPLLTKFNTVSGEKNLWTTFSDDQIDLNFGNPEVLLEILDIFLFYAEKGAEYIRLDAIAYAWKEIGTSCIHLPQTHRLIKLIRLVLNKTAHQIKLVTETNVAHTENISYFGNGINEAQLVYNFALPPLVLFGILTGNAKKISNWASKLILPSKQTTFFNFLASHDGIGLNPARGILADDEINYLVTHTENIGGFVSYKNNPDGSQSPYELNINYFDALFDPKLNLSQPDQINRFILAHAILFSLIGLPGIYFHSMIGSKSWHEGVNKTGKKRAINRQKLSYHKLDKELSEPGNRRYEIYLRLANLLKARSSSPAFHPLGYQTVIDYDDRIFAYVRTDQGKNTRVMCLHNLSNDIIEVEVKFIDKFLEPNLNKCIDLISKRPLASSENGSLLIKPYQFYWLTKIG